MTLSGVFPENSWLWLIVSTVFIFGEPFAVKLHNFWETAIFPKPEKTNPPTAPEEVRKMTEAYNRLLHYRQTHRWVLGWGFSIFYTVCMAFTVASLVVLATEYSALVNLHHEKTYTLLMSFVVTSVILAKTYPVLLHWLIYPGWKFASAAIALVNVAVSVTTVILLGILDTDPRVAVAAGLFVPFVVFEIAMFILICIVNWRDYKLVNVSA
jgi:hypothetical protein